MHLHINKSDVIRYNDLSTWEHIYSPGVPPPGSLLKSAHNQSHEMLLMRPKHRTVLFSIVIGHPCVFVLWRDPCWLGGGVSRRSPRAPWVAITKAQAGGWASVTANSGIPPLSFLLCCSEHQGKVLAEDLRSRDGDLHGGHLPPHIIIGPWPFSLASNTCVCIPLAAFP